MARLSFSSVACLLTLAVAGAIGVPAWTQTTANAPQMSAAAAPAPVVDVPVTRVVLFSSGVGYFEHNGSATGSITAELRFETAQINDVLKSLVVFDKGGHVQAITYPANDPVNRTLRSFQVNLSGDPPLADILKQMRGASVTISVADEHITGTILGVEPKERAVGMGAAEKVMKTFVVNLVTDTGIRSVSLDDVRKLEILDEKVRKEMNQALAALVQARDQSKKTVTLHFEGTAKRAVGMGYLVETPIWKATYRLMLPDAGSKSPAELQGWAIVENQTDNDWDNVALSLVGGRPISFIEMLYQPLYVARPVIQPSIAANIVPQTYDNGINPLALPESMAVRRNAPTLSLGNSSQQGGMFGGNNANNFRLQNGINTDNQMQTGAQGTAPIDLAQTDFSQGVAAIAEATKIGEMFHYTVEKVSLPRQQSSMIPIIAEGVLVDRVSIYSPTMSTKFAMRGLRLHNRTGKFLLGGPITVMDTTKEGNSYAGDARIEDIPTGQSRLLSYAIDQDAVIQVSKDSGDEALLTGSVVKGVLWLQYRSSLNKEYTLQNKSENPKTIVIETPVMEGYELKEPAKPLEKTERVYRIEVTLAAKETKKVPVVLERTRSEQMAIVEMKEDPMAIYMQQSAIPAKVREVLSTVAKKRMAVADLDRRRAMRELDRAQVLQEQANIRENIKVLPVGNKSQEDAIRDLGTKDAELKAANKDISELKGAVEAARNDLTKYLESTTIE